MGQPVTLFSSYETEENRTRNNCLVILKLLYDEEPKFFCDALQKLVRKDFSGSGAVDFSQQESMGAITPDGFIRHRDSKFTILIETKTDERFRPDQLENHLSALNGDTTGSKFLIVLSNFEGDELTRFLEVRKAFSVSFPEIIVERVSFQEFLWAIDLPGLPKYLANAVRDLEGYFRRVALFPEFDRLLFAPERPYRYGKKLDGAYLTCPANGMERSRFLGFYEDVSSRNTWNRLA